MRELVEVQASEQYLVELAQQRVEQATCEETIRILGDEVVARRDHVVDVVERERVDGLQHARKQRPQRIGDHGTQQAQQMRNLQQLGDVLDVVSGEARQQHGHQHGLQLRVQVRVVAHVLQQRAQRV